MAKELTSSPRLMPPPSERYSVFAWLHKNLFSTWYNTLLTLVAVGLIFAIVLPFIRWVFVEAQWRVIQVNSRLLMVGQYPRGELWRVWLCLYLLATIIGMSWGVWARRRRWLGLAILSVPICLALLPGASTAIRMYLIGLGIAALLAFGIGLLGGTRLRRLVTWSWILYFFLVMIIIRGIGLSGELLPIVPTNVWGGLLLTFILTIVGIVFSFPLGVLLALGRRSRLPVVRGVSIGYIEIIRGVPLVTILFMASTMLTFFLPPGTRPDLILRAMVGITLFSAAYLAENVRGGLQAIPTGQYEAAYALGLSGLQTLLLITLPQALRIVIPVLLGQFIALFKDTTLVVTIGILELLGIARSVLAQPQFVGFQREVYLFVALIFWVFCYLMSYISQRLETALSVGDR